MALVMLFGTVSPWLDYGSVTVSAAETTENETAENGEGTTSGSEL